MILFNIKDDVVETALEPTKMSANGRKAAKTCLRRIESRKFDPVLQHASLN